jgi:hypothetical protein
MLPPSRRPDRPRFPRGLPCCFRNCSKGCVCLVVREVKDEQFGGQCNDRRILAALHQHGRWPSAKKLRVEGVSTGSNRSVSHSREQARALLGLRPWPPHLQPWQVGSLAGRIHGQISMIGSLHDGSLHDRIHVRQPLRALVGQARGAPLLRAPALATRGVPRSRVAAPSSPKIPLPRSPYQDPHTKIHMRRPLWQLSVPRPRSEDRGRLAFQVNRSALAA